MSKHLAKPGEKRDVVSIERERERGREREKEGDE
jgi:hypothetical protein